jgi:uncharacterized membrane protein YdjX (TVP38/TMEM64 family)
MNKKQLVKGMLFIALVIAIICLELLWDLSSYFNPVQIQEWLASAGIFAPLVYIIIMSLAVVISPIPSLPLDIAAGLFFGPFLGTLYSVIGALSGAVASFLITRLLGRELIERFIGGHINFCANCSDRLLTKIVFLSRLLPVVSFDIVSYGAGLTKMSIKKFAIATFLGMIPLTFVYNYFGSVLVFSKELTLVLGIILVVLFFVMPRWIEKMGFMKNMKHE